MNFLFSLSTYFSIHWSIFLYDPSNLFSFITAKLTIFQSKSGEPSPNLLLNDFYSVLWVNPRVSKKPISTSLGTQIFPILRNLQFRNLAITRETLGKSRFFLGCPYSTASTLSPCLIPTSFIERVQCSRSTRKSHRILSTNHFCRYPFHFIDVLADCGHPIGFKSFGHIFPFIPMHSGRAGVILLFWNAVNSLVIIVCSLLMLHKFETTAAYYSKFWPMHRRRTEPDFSALKGSNFPQSW